MTEAENSNVDMTIMHVRTSSLNCLFWQDEAREAREHYSREHHELHGALEAQEQEVKQLHSDISQAQEKSHEAESRVEGLQSELIALQGLQAETEKDKAACKRQLHQYEKHVQEQEVGLLQACSYRTSDLRASDELVRMAAKLVIGVADLLAQCAECAEQVQTSRRIRASFCRI